MHTKSFLLALGNAALYLATCALIGTGLLLELRMDEEDGVAWLFGMGQDDWGEIHLAVAIAFAALVALHIVQNRAWIKAAISRSKPAIMVLLAGLILVVGLLLWPTTSMNRSPSEQLRHILDNY